MVNVISDFPLVYNCFVTSGNPLMGKFYGPGTAARISPLSTGGENGLDGLSKRLKSSRRTIEAS